MSTVKRTNAQTVSTPAPAAEKRVILTMGGKGGVGKTGLMVALAEWFRSNEVSVKLLVGMMTGKGGP
jgi:Mrp family chromosome partitioning ATPase